MMPPKKRPEKETSGTLFGRLSKKAGSRRRGENFHANKGGGKVAQAVVRLLHRRSGRGPRAKIFACKGSASENSIWEFTLSINEAKIPLLEEVLDLEKGRKGNF